MFNLAEEKACDIQCTNKHTDHSSKRHAQQRTKMPSLKCGKIR